MEESAKLFNEIIDELKEYGLSQSDIGELTEISASNISKYRNQTKGVHLYKYNEYIDTLEGLLKDKKNKEKKRFNDIWDNITEVYKISEDEVCKRGGITKEQVDIARSHVREDIRLYEYKKISDKLSSLLDELTQENLSEEPQRSKEYWFFKKLRFSIILLFAAPLLMICILIYSGYPKIIGPVDGKLSAENIHYKFLKEIAELQNNGNFYTEDLNQSLYSSVFHLFFIGMLLSLYLSKRGGWRRMLTLEEGFLKSAFNQFHKGFLFALWAWVLLYGSFSIKWIVQSSLIKNLDFTFISNSSLLDLSTDSSGYYNYILFSVLSWSIIDIVNLLNSVLFFFCFCVLDLKSVYINKAPEGIIPFKKTLRKFLLIATFILLASIYDRFCDLGDLESVGTYIYSLFTCVAFLFLFGKLGSGQLYFSRTNYTTMGILYLYAAIQVGYSSLTFVSNVVSFLIIAIAILGKYFLFDLLNDWMKDGTMEKYFRKMYKIIYSK